MQVHETLVPFFVGYYNRTKKIPDSEVAKIIMIETYKMYLKYGLTPIEDLMQQQKDNLVKQVGQSRVRCRILHLINKLNEKPN